jgi:hypothetical protein
MLDRAKDFVGKCSISIEVRWVEILAIPMPYFVWVKISPEYKAILIIGMLIFIAATWGTNGGPTT